LYIAAADALRSPILLGLGPIFHAGRDHIATVDAWAVASPLPHHRKRDLVNSGVSGRL